MSKVKRGGVKIPLDFANTLEKMVDNEDKTVSVLGREIPVEYLESEISLSAWEIIEKGQREYRKGKCIPWREVC